jgi:hypothetical protein
MHIAQKLSPTPKSKWAFWFKHTLAVLAMTVLAVSGGRGGG